MSGAGRLGARCVEHGLLARNCPLCEAQRDAERVHELEVKIAALESRNAELEAEVAELKRQMAWRIDNWTRCLDAERDHKKAAEARIANAPKGRVDSWAASDAVVIDELPAEFAFVKQWVAIVPLQKHEQALALAQRISK